MAFALPASAATHPAGVNNGAVYSTYLACHALNGNGDLKLYEVWAQLQNLPNPGTSVPADTLVQGFALTHSDVNGGPTYGLGAVWATNDTANSTCGASAWAIEGSLHGYPEASNTSPEPVPAADLTPLTEGGSDICISPGGSVFLQAQLNNRHHSLNYLVGPTERDNDIVNVLPVHTDFNSFAGAGEGISTYYAAGSPEPSDAQDINTGTVFQFNTFAVGILKGHGVTANQAVGNPSSPLGYLTYTGTETGAAPTDVNLTTLTPSGFTRIDYGSENTVTAP